MHTPTSLTERFCAVSTVELLQKIHILPKPHPSPSSTSTTNGTLHRLPRSPFVQPETAIEKLAYRFNQVSSCDAHVVLM